MNLEMKRKNIMEAVLFALNEKGADVTVEDVAKKAGVSKKTIYNNFVSKSGLVDVAIEYTFEQIKNRENFIINDKEMDIIDKLKKLVIVLPDRYRNIDFRKIGELKERNSDIYMKILSRIESDWEPTLMLFEEAIRQGRIRNVSLPVIRTMIEASIEIFMDGKELRQCGIEYETAMREMINIIVDGIRIK